MSRTSQNDTPHGRRAGYRRHDLGHFGGHRRGASGGGHAGRRTHAHARGDVLGAGRPAADGNHHLPSGLWNEFREALRAHYGGAEALATGWVSNTLFEPHVADSIFRAMAAAEPRLEVLHGYVLDKVYKRGNCVTAPVSRVVGATGSRSRLVSRSMPPTWAMRCP